MSFISEFDLDVSAILFGSGIIALFGFALGVILFSIGRSNRSALDQMKPRGNAVLSSHFKWAYSTGTILNLVLCYLAAVNGVVSGRWVLAALALDAMVTVTICYIFKHRLRRPVHQTLGS